MGEEEIKVLKVILSKRSSLCILLNEIPMDGLCRALCKLLRRGGGGMEKLSETGAGKLPAKI